MPSPSRTSPAGQVRRSAVLAFVFAGVVAAGAATGSWPQAADGTELSARGGAPPWDDDPSAADAERVVARQGDEWSAAYSEEEYERLRQGLAGEYVGTGIAVTRTPEGAIEVSEVHEGSPAARAGIRPGDLILTIDGDRLTGAPVTDAVSRLRGSDDPGDAGPGSTVVLGLERDGHRWEEVVARERLTIETVSVSRAAPGVTRIEVTSFTQGAADQLRAAVESVPEGDGIVLDLRGNAGGLLAEAAEAASVFLDGGVVATYDVYGEERVLTADRDGDTGTPLVVLVDGGTMSSAEMLTGALQDRNRAVIVGSRTFGKGTVQMPSEQPDGSVAELTVGHYETPSGRTIDENGIVPDLVVAPGEDAEEKAASVVGGVA
jgi:carboxyl-terminal processing protease